MIDIVVVTKEENDRLNDKYRTSMPNGWKFGDDPNARHDAVGIRYSVADN